MGEIYYPIKKSEISLRTSQNVITVYIIAQPNNLSIFMGNDWPRDEKR